MFVTAAVTPQIADTDMQGHINFLAYSKWFDRVRTPIYRELDPTLNFKPHGMVVLKTEVTYLREVSVPLAYVRAFLHRPGYSMSYPSKTHREYARLNSTDGRPVL